MARNTREIFRTHANYISAIRYVASGGILGNANAALEQLASRVSDSGCLNIPKRTDIDLNQIHRSLNNAWGIEALFKMGNVFIKEDDLIRLSNNWFVVQAYYIFYYSTQALSVSEGYSKPRTHPQLHRTYYLLWSQKPWLLSPWCISYGKDGFHNLPPGIFIDDSVHSWKKVDELTALNLFCKAVRTTRDEFITDALARRKERLAMKKPSAKLRLTKKQKKQTKSRARPTTIINYLYRLKRKTSYEQSSILAAGPENIYQSKEIRENLSFIIEATLLITEMITSRIVGQATFYSWCMEWEKYKSPAMKDIGPSTRLNIIHNN
ncbi:hypothetical protein MYX76_07270 [Desulfobacterota bacterium AH_259_B03_O07]|nr:hypothetical protein [Desulfobacterota bacterium AH_259_B03_O07]